MKMFNFAKIWQLITAESELRKRVLLGIVMIALIGIPILSGGALFVVMLFALCVLATVEYLQIAKTPKFLPMALIVLVFACVYYLRETNAGLQKIVVLSLTIAFFDTFAYFVGKAIGKHKLAPQISPGKTIEGFVGGVLLATLCVIPLYYLFSSAVPFACYVILIISLAILSQIGDLIESAFKRKYDVKDSGAIIPGHGGILDRFDGYILTAPFFTFIDIILKINEIQIF